MPGAPYSNRGLDARFANIEEKFDTIIAQTTPANIKMCKIIMALILAFGLINGMGFDQFASVLAVIAGL